MREISFRRLPGALYSAGLVAIVLVAATAGAALASKPILFCAQCVVACPKGANCYVSPKLKANDVLDEEQKALKAEEDAKAAKQHKKVYLTLGKFLASTSGMNPKPCLAAIAPFSSAFTDS